MEDSNDLDKEWGNIQRQPVTRSLLYFLTSLHKPEEAHLRQGFEKAGIPPERSTSALWLSRFLGGLGLSLLLAGILFFFAYNWADLHKFAKIGIGWSALLLAGIFTLAQPKGSFPFQLGLTAQTALTGILLVLIGQIYQTGANAYDFFLAWSVLSILWVAASQFPPLWLLYLVLINTTTILYAVQVRLIVEEGKLMLTLAIINGLALALWEYNKLKAPNKPLLMPRWFPQVSGLAVYIFLGVSAMVFLYEPTIERGIAILLFTLLTAGAGYFYSHYIKDLVFLGFSIVALLVWVNNFIIWLLAKTLKIDFVICFFVNTTITTVITVIAVRWLININKKWKKAEIQATPAN